MTENDLHWKLQAFHEIEPLHWYLMAAARIAVFVVEQTCPYQELDGADLSAHHVSAWNRDQQLIAYARILAPGQRYVEASIGRVLTVMAARGQGLGFPLMRRSIQYCHQLYPDHGISIAAQHRLLGFYQQLGFIAHGGVYLEDGIEHIDMRLTLDG